MEMYNARYYTLKKVKNLTGFCLFFYFQNRIEYKDVISSAKSQNSTAKQPVYTISDDSNPAVPFEAWMQTASEKG